MDNTSRKLTIESLTWYSTGISLIFIRLWSRAKRDGISLKPEDKAMIAAAMWYTIFTIMNLLSALEFNAGKSTTDSTAGRNELAYSNMRDSYIKGSKFICIAEQGLINLLYTLKGCMLVIFWRLTLGRRSQTVVKILAGYVLIGWTTNQIAFFMLTCQPFSGNWASPPPSLQCISWQNYAIVQGVLNISSDLAILIFPIPLFVKTEYPLKQKIYLCSIFSVGFMVILCALLCKINLNNSSWQFWKVREAGTAVYVSNIPVLVPLMRSFIKSTRERCSRTKSPSENSHFAAEVSGCQGDSQPSTTVDKMRIEMDDLPVGFGSQKTCVEGTTRSIVLSV